MATRVDFDKNGTIKFIVLGNPGELVNGYAPESSQRVVLMGFKDRGQGSAAGIEADKSFRSVDMVCIEHGKGFENCRLKGAVQSGGVFFVADDKQKISSWLDGLEDIKVIDADEKKKAVKELGLIGPARTSDSVAGIA